MIDNGMDGRMTELYNVAVIMARFEKNMEGEKSNVFQRDTSCKSYRNI